MYRGLLLYGGVEIVNSRRTVAHILNGIRPGSLEVRHDDSWPHTNRLLAHPSYVLPDTAPWHDPTDPDSLEFAGVWPMSVSGLDTSPLSREIVEGIGDGGTVGISRFTTRTITVTALLVGSSPSGAEFGLRWLTERLRGPMDGLGRGAELRFLSSAPELDAELTGVATRAAMAGRWRTVHEVVTTEAPAVQGRFGFTDGQDGQASVFAVSWTMAAGIPHVFRDPDPAVTGLSLAGAPAVSPTWSVAVDGACDFGCDTPAGSSMLRDPDTAAVATVMRELTAIGGGVCVPLSSKRISAAVPGAARRVARPEVTRVALSTGGGAVRGLRLQWVANPTGGPIDDAESCGALTEIGITYIPADSTLTIDGATGQVWCDTLTGRLDAIAVVRGAGGAPWRPALLDTADAYALIVDAPATATALTVDAWTIARES